MIYQLRKNHGHISYRFWDLDAILQLQETLTVTPPRILWVKFTKSEIVPQSISTFFGVSSYIPSPYHSYWTYNCCRELVYCTFTLYSILAFSIEIGGTYARVFCLSDMLKIVTTNFSERSIDWCHINILSSSHYYNTTPRTFFLPSFAIPTVESFLFVVWTQFFSIEFSREENFSYWWLYKITFR